MLFWNLAKRTVCILICAALLLAYALPSFAEDEDIQESGSESATAEVADDEYSSDGESAQNGETDITDGDTAQAASEIDSDESGDKGNAAESTESEDDENSSDSTEENASEDSRESAESITFSALEAEESGEASEVNEEESQTEVEEIVYAESITLSETSVELLVGTELELEVVITPEDAIETVEWSSSDEEVASVESGLITAVSAGTVTITATVGELAAVCEVTVFDETDVTFVWADEITAVVTVRKGTTAEALSIADMPDGEALDEYRTGEYDVAWYMNVDFTEKFDFTTEITEPVTLYAKFLETLSVEYVWSNSLTTVSTVFADSCADSLELGDAPKEIQSLYDVRYQVIWYSDALLTETYDFESAVTEDLTLYADYDFLPEMEWFSDTTKSSYTLVTAAELQSLAVLTAAGYTFAGVTIYLGNDGTDDTEAGTLDLSDIEWEPIGTAEHPFAGTFDGGIYGEVDGETGLTGTFTLSGLSLGSYKEFDYAGLFGYVTGNIRNVTVSGTVYVTAQYAGGIVGWLEGTITNCTNQTNVYNYEADGIIGGIAGYVNGSVYNCANEGTRVYNRTEGNGSVGGIVGSICGYVTDSVNSGRYVTGKGYTAGGIAGVLQSSSQVLRCTNSAQVGNTADSAAGGGIVGEMEYNTTVQYCGNTGAITSTAAAGGIVGRLTGTGTVESCFNSGDVTYGKSSRGGGILGYSENGYEDVISQCCNLSTQDGTFLDADYVTATTDAGEAAYIMDNGGSEERYDVWGWINGDKTPSLLSSSQDAAQTYYVKLVASKSRVEPLTQNYYPVGDTVTIYAANNLEDGDEWLVKGIDDYEISEEQDCITFDMPAEDVTISVTVANPNTEYTITFYGYVNSDNEYTTYSSQTVKGGELAVAPEEQDGAKDINAYYAYYEDEDFCGYYVFTGWYLMDKNGDLSEQYDFDWMVGEDIILYAEWSLITVQFSFNGVKTTTTLPSSYKIGVGATLPEPTPEPETSVAKTSFLGWSLQSTLSEAELTDTDENWKWIFVADGEDEEETSESDESLTPTVLALEDTTDLKLLLYAVWGNSITDWVKNYSVSGTGTESDPFVISTDEQLNAMSELMTEDEDLTGYYFELSDTGDNGGIFTLTESIVGYHDYYTYYDGSQDVDAEVEVFEIGTFNGIFDGGGCTVDVGAAQIGLFGVLGEDSEVRNLNLVGDVDGSEYTSSDSDYYIVVVSMDSTGYHSYKGTGALASVGYGLIENCTYSDGTLKDNNKGSSPHGVTGGIVGIIASGGQIDGCTTSGAEIYGDYAGGIVGAVTGGGTISDCTVESTIIFGDIAAGGVVAVAYNDYIFLAHSEPSGSDINCEISGCEVLLGDNGDGEICAMAAGGIVGGAEFTIVNDCKNQVPITQKDGAYSSTNNINRTGNDVYLWPSAGGIVGVLYVGAVVDCTNAEQGSITGNAAGYSGGIVGLFATEEGVESKIQNCENNACITFNGYFCGGVVGRASAIGGGTLSVTDCDSSGEILLNNSTDCTQLYVGGLIGACWSWSVLNSSQSTSETQTFNANNCTVTGDMNLSTDSTSISYMAIGGVVGGFRGVGNFTNWDVEITDIEVKSNISLQCAYSAQYVGGVFGYAFQSFNGAQYSLNSLECSNIKLNNVGINVEAQSASYIGGISGYLQISDAAQLEAFSWDSIAIDVNTTGSTGAEYIGGLTGKMYLSASDDESESGEDNVDLEFENGIGNITITFDGIGSHIGGLAGLITADSGSISGEFNDIAVNILDSGTYIGGLAGEITGNVIVSAACEDFDVEIEKVDSFYAGGIVGSFSDASIQDTDSAGLSYCSYDGDVKIGDLNNDGAVGGLVGWGNVVYSYFVGDFDFTGSTWDGSVGLLAGEGAAVSSFFYGDCPGNVNVTYTEDNITASYYLGSSDGNEQSKTESEFKSGYVAWLMEIGGDEEDIGDHAFIWKQASKYPEWSNGEATVYRVGVANDLVHVEITLSDSKECAYLNDDDDDGVEVTVTVSDDTYTVTEDDEEVEYGYVLQSFSHISEPDEATTTLKTYSTEDNITVLTYNYTPTSDGRMSAAVTVVQLEADEVIPPVAEEEGEGDGDGSGDDDSDGSGGSGGGDGTGYGGTDETTAGTSVPTIGSDEEGPTVISDTSPDVQIEETVGEEAPAGGTEAEETVEAPETETEAESEIEPEPEPESEPEPEPEEEAEPEVHTYELIANIVEAIKENPLLAVLAGVGAIVVCVGSGIYRYLKNKREYD